MIICILQKTYGQDKFGRRRDGNNLAPRICARLGFLKAATFGKKFEKQMLKVGDGSFTDNQKEQLIGLKPGDSVRIALPDNEDKTITNPYQLKVAKVERENLPEVDDDFLKLINPELGSVDDLRADVLKKINENFYFIPNSSIVSYVPTLKIPFYSILYSINISCCSRIHIIELPNRYFHYIY